MNDFVKSFDKLIKSFKEKWFNKNYPILVSKEWIPIDWHHRVSCCLVFNETPNFTINNKISIKNYNWLNFFLNTYYKNCFSKKELLKIINEYSKYNKIYIIEENSNKNLEILWKLKLVFKESIIINWKKVKNFNLSIIKWNSENKKINIEELIKNINKIKENKTKNFLFENLFYIKNRTNFILIKFIKKIWIYNLLSSIWRKYILKKNNV